MAFSLLPGYWESQLLLVVTLGLSGVVVNRTFTLRGVDVCTRLFVDHCCVNVFICVLNFLLTAKFSQSKVSSLSFINVLKPFTWLHISTANYVIMSYLCDTPLIKLHFLKPWILYSSNLIIPCWVRACVHRACMGILLLTCMMNLLLVCESCLRDTPNITRP